jgi:hypothetical protein
MGKTFEIKLTGTDGDTSGSETVLVNVASTNVSTNLLLDYQADFATGLASGSNSPFTSTWSNLLFNSTALDGLLNLGTFLTGWVGDGTWTTNPYRLRFDGVSGGTASRAVAGTGLNAQATPFFTAWVKPLNVSAGTLGHVLGNSDGTNGWALVQNTAGSFSFNVGTGGVASSGAVVLSLNPVLYYKFDETSGTAVTDYGSAANNATIQNAGNVALNQTGAYSGSTSFRFTSTGYVKPNATQDINGTWSISAWMKFPLSGSAWKTLTRGTQNHQVLFQDSTNIIGSYDNAGGTTFRSSGFDTDTLSAGWHHVAAVASAGTTTFYIDGTQAGSAIPYVAVDDIQAVGNIQSGGQPAFDVDDFALFNTALTPSQVLQIYQGGCSAALTQNEWAHVAGLYNGSTASIYKNGALVCSATPTGGSVTASPAQFSIGAREGGSNAWNGEVAQVQVYSSGTGANVLTNFNSEFDKYRYPSSCSDWYARGYTTSGTYYINHTTLGNIQVYCDQVTDGGGWMLVLNYLHQGGTNPALSAKTASLPVVGSSTLGTNESANASYWGHAAPSLLSQFSYTNLRFYCVTAGHSRVVDFKTSDASCKAHFNTGTGTCTGVKTSYTALTGHTGHLPASLDNGFSNQGSSAMTNFPMYKGGTDHWGISGSGSRWECDDYPGGSALNTLHRIYIK